RHRSERFLGSRPGTPSRVGTGMPPDGHGRRRAGAGEADGEALRERNLLASAPRGRLQAGFGTPPGDVNLPHCMSVWETVGCPMPRNDPGSPDPVPAANVADLVRAARVGDREAFGQLVTLHQSAVTRLAYRLLGDMDEADGAAQDAFIRAWSRLGE